MNLLTSYYETNNEERQKEINECLIRNINNEYIKKIYLMVDKIYDLSFLSEKVVQVLVDEESKDRLKFKYVFEYCNNNLNGEICIIANSDIYYDETLKLLENYDLENKFIVLSRYDNGKLRNINCSQDSWIFKSPIKIDLNEINFQFGRQGCDNRLAYILYNNNYDIKNPSKDIKSHHLHDSKYRTYNESSRIRGLYYFIMPHNLNDKNIIYQISKHFI